MQALNGSIHKYMNKKFEPAGLFGLLFSGKEGLPP